MFAVLSEAEDGCEALIDFKLVDKFAKNFGVVPKLCDKATLFRCFHAGGESAEEITFPAFVEIVGRLALSIFSADSLAPSYPTTVEKVTALFDWMHASQGLSMLHGNEFAQVASPSSSPHYLCAVLSLCHLCGLLSTPSDAKCTNCRTFVSRGCIMPSLRDFLHLSVLKQCYQ